MTNKIKEGQSLTIIEKNIEKEVGRCEFWGDLELSVEELEVLKNRIRDFFVFRDVSVYYMCKNYPHALTTYMVFFVRYKYNVNFWGAISDELGVDLPQFHQADLGRCAKKMFARYHMDVSETSDETKRRRAREAVRGSRASFC